MSVAALIFDVDGTLADTEGTHRLAFNQAFVDHGLRWTWGPKRYAKLLAVTGGKERMLAYIDSLDVDAAERKRVVALVPALHETKGRRYAERVRRREVSLRPGVARLLREAREQGVRLAIASTTCAQNVTELLTATLGAASLSWFDAMCCGDSVRAKKPAPDVYHAALAALRLEASQCVAFEDSANGLAAARAAGLFTIVTPTVWTQDEDLHAANAVYAGLDAPAVGMREINWLMTRRLVCSAKPR